MTDATTHRPPATRRVAAILAPLVAVLAVAVPFHDAAAAASGSPTGGEHTIVATHTTAGDRVTFGIEPASASGADGRPDFSFAVTPGAVLVDHVAVLDYSSRPLDLEVYATDGIETPSGGYSLLPAGKRPTGAGAWIALPAKDRTVAVPPRTASGPGEVVIPMLVRVPATASPGDHAGGVVASLTTTGRNSSGQNIVLVQRVATRVFFHVAGKLAPGVSVTGLRSSYSGTANPVGRGDLHVTYTLRNTGNTDLGVHQSVAVSGLFGSAGRAALQPVALLLPGVSLHESATIDGVLPELRLHATVAALAVASPGGPAPDLPRVTASVSTWAIPWALFALLGGIVLIAVAYVTRERWMPHRLVAQTEAAQP